MDMFSNHVTFCPGCNKTTISWKHFGCNGKMLIYNNRELECEKCRQRFEKNNARYNCTDHSVMYRPFWLKNKINFRNILIYFTIDQ